MSHAYDSEEMEREIELGIVSAFGWAVIEFEAVLFQKFLVMSGPTSLITEDMFRKYLLNMEAKGFVSPVDFQGRKAWKRLVIESEIEEPAMTPEDVKEFIAKAQAASTKKKKNILLPVLTVKGEETVLYVISSQVSEIPVQSFFELQIGY